MFIRHCLLPTPRHRQESIYDLVRSRCGWLLLFFGGLVLAAFVVEAFEEVIKQHVQLAWFGELRCAALMGTAAARRVPFRAAGHRLAFRLGCCSEHARHAAAASCCCLDFLLRCSAAASCCCRRPRPTCLPAVPLLIGHGGNTGSQSNATVIRALALGHLRSSDWLMVVYKASRVLAEWLAMPRCLLWGVCCGAAGWKS